MPTSVFPSEGPLIDVVIAVHTTARPLARAIESCGLDGRPGVVRVTVVCHNVGSADIQESLGMAPSPGLRFIEHFDGLNSPAGPKNAGLAAVEAPFTAVLDSDDYFEPGALSHWLDVLETSGADVVVAPVRHQAGDLIRTPRARIGRVHGLDPVKDRLAYATAPRGLWRTETAAGVGFHYTEGLRTGEDLEAGLRLYFSGTRLEFPAHGPAYVLGDDAEDRVTADFLPCARELEPVSLVCEGWAARQTASVQRAVAIKLARTNLIGALSRRGPEWDWSAPDLAALRQTAGQLRELSPGYASVLTIAEGKLVEALGSDAVTGEKLASVIAHYKRSSLVARILSPSLRGNLDPESNLRHAVRLLFDRRRK
ncbi:glycosyltransferase family A protein [Arthrobacter sp. ERGS1:01]|uniref:glycosyltransferase family A protein n=1 Tax=Arthrobacter sp. ERGS1:01 TaxID=1704044 RepID=UPI000B11111F|nr:glycosyltransferase family A protein [Arthrobacter sp. ERGS1:01]